MAKRFTDNEKWQDSWFTDLTNDQKIIWIYLLDHCDNAGLWKLNMKNLNYFCSTNISVEDLISIFKKRLTQVSPDLFLINKFCTFQYGADFLNSKNKAVQAAINKLISVGIVQLSNGIYTLSIPYTYPIDTLLQISDTPKEKEKEKDKDKDIDKVKFKEQEKVKGKVQLKEYEKEQLKECIKKLNITDEIKYAFECMVNGICTPKQKEKVLENKKEFDKILGVKTFIENYK